MKHRSGWWALVAALGVVGACTLKTETVSGPKGEKGEQGVPGMVDPTELAELKAQIKALDAKVAALENKAADTDCPAGYDLAPPPNPAMPDVIRCIKGPQDHPFDEMVKVGFGNAAFWIDRFEASVFDDSNATSDVTPEKFPPNAQVKSKSGFAFARSVKNRMPTPATWFQAQAACAGSGKRLPTDEEWTLAAMGTFDPPDDISGNGTNGLCVTSAQSPRSTGAAKADVNCVSIWGAEDMIGNFNERTATWYAGVNNFAGPSDWPTGYGDDRTWNIAGSVDGPPNDPANHPGLPAASTRGGYWQLGKAAGVFSMMLLTSPTENGSFTNGFRCLIPR